jgi:hypothetical protein
MAFRFGEHKKKRKKKEEFISRQIEKSAPQIQNPMKCCTDELEGHTDTCHRRTTPRHHM